MSAIRSFIKKYCAFLLPLINIYLGLRYRNKSVQEIFQHIHNQNDWQGKAASGQGSDLGQTAVIREEIPKLLAKYQVRSLLDIPCGDFYWQNQVDLPVETYIGADIVQDLIDANSRQYGNEKLSFVRLDITSDELSQADLILCRDCLVHFSFENIRKALNRIKNSGATYLLATTFTGPRTNQDIQTGCWRKVNLQAPPFNFPEPIELINEKCTEGSAYADKSLGLWRVADIP